MRFYTSNGRLCVAPEPDRYRARPLAHGLADTLSEMKLLDVSRAIAHRLRHGRPRSFLAGVAGDLEMERCECGAIETWRSSNDRDRHHPASRTRSRWASRVPERRSRTTSTRTVPDPRRAGATNHFLVVA